MGRREEFCGRRRKKLKGDDFKEERKLEYMNCLFIFCYYFFIKKYSLQQTRNFYFNLITLENKKIEPHEYIFNIISIYS